jgi:diacylglycerol kinase (ATP)
MGQFKNALFIVNPSSGRKTIPTLERDIAAACKANQTEHSIIYTTGPGHATTLAREASQNSIDVVFAIGGDGTVNEVAKGLINSPTIMGVIPKGSGNGLARHLGISMKPNAALSVLSTGKIFLMDTISVNGETSVNVSGIGFDGHIASLFGKSGKRGLREYVTLAATEFRKFKNFPIEGIIDGQTYSSEAFILAFANSSQFGNNATISPAASVCDGVMDICVIKKVPLLQALGFAGKMFTRRMHKSAFVKIIKAKSASFTFPNAMPVHVDGEGREASPTFNIEMRPGSLRVLAPSGAI